MPRKIRERRLGYRDKVDASGATRRAYFVNETHMASVRIDAGATPRERKRARRLEREYAGAVRLPPRRGEKLAPPSGAAAPALPPTPPMSKPAASKSPPAAPATWPEVMQFAAFAEVPVHVRVTLNYQRHQGLPPERGVQTLAEYAEAQAGTAEIRAAGDHVEHVHGIR